MAKGLNKVVLIGNLGHDPEIIYTPSGTGITNIRLATTSGKKNQSGEWDELTEWHRVIFFGRLAEICKDYLKKGSRVYIEGRLQTRSWEDKDGQRQYRTEIIGNLMIMLDRLDRGDQPKKDD